MHQTHDLQKQRSRQRRPRRSREVTPARCVYLALHYFLFIGNTFTQSAVKVKKETQDAPKPKVADSDELNSDLDDSDDEVDKEGGDLVIALYEKARRPLTSLRWAQAEYTQVNRVRNRWKIQLKDGVVNVKGKDYLFNKCAGCVRLASLTCEPY